MAQLPAYMSSRKRVIRSTVNPLDKSTIVSIFPHKFSEYKPTIQPGNFDIAPGSYDKPSTLVIGTSSWWKDMEEGQPDLEIVCSSMEVANSVVRDFCNGLLKCDMMENMPGLFFIPGEWTSAQLKTNGEHRNKLDIAKRRQENWYKELIQEADKLWARTNGNPLVIWDFMKLAAQELQLKDKPWMKDFTTLELNNCPACGVLRNSNFPICASCGTIVDAKKYKDLGLAKVV